MLEKDLYPAVETFLKHQKNCIAEYVGTELSLKRGLTRLRADVFRVSNDREKKASVICDGKKELN